MKTCRHCRRTAPENTYLCTTCERPLPFAGPNAKPLGKIGMTVGIRSSSERS